MFAATALVATTACGGSGGASDAGPVGPVVTSRLALGDTFACGITGDGGVKCWGSNLDGQLGNSAPAISSTVDFVTGLTGGVTNLAAGGASACAVTAAGGVVCWGSNCIMDPDGGTVCLSPSGGSVTLPQGNVPVVPPTQVKAFATGVLAVGIGGASLCAIRTNRTVACLGYGEGASGAGSGFFSTPFTMPDLSGASALSMGFTSACAIAAGGRLVCWGANYAGQLGDGTTNESNIPVQVSGLTSGVTAVAVSQEYACAVTAGGGVVCWGNNDNQQLGNGSTTSSSLPVPVTGLESGATAVAVSGTDALACAVTHAGGLVCWGLGKPPAPVANLAEKVTAVASGQTFICVLTTSGSVECWGGFCQPMTTNPLCAKTPTVVPGF